MQCPRCNASNPEDSQYCAKCGTPLGEIDDTLTHTPATHPPPEDTLDFAPGESFGPRYKIIEEIGRGGMGRVYKAKDKELGITVALKMIHPEYSAKPHIIERFKKETLLARSLTHENVIRIYDLGEVDKIKFISMSYIKGQNLKELILTSGTLSVETVISITKQICEALRVAHSKGIVHRDLKPQNILVDNNGRVFVTDFGVAKSVEVQEDSAPGIIIGTIQYISPEQAEGEKADLRSDLYSLGIIIYEMLTGEKPFKAETYTGYIQKHIHEKPKPPSKINPNIPSYLEKIILKCLEKDKHSRYQRAEEILHDLEEHKVATRPFVPRIRTKKLFKATYVSVLVVLIVAVAYLWIKKRPSGPFLTEDLGRSVAVLPFENNTGDENQDYWGKALSNMLTHDLLQSKLIRILTEDRLQEILGRLNLQEAKTYTSEDLKKVAGQGRVSHILTGNYTKAEDTFRIYTKLQNIVTGELKGSKVEGKGESTFYSAVDQLTPWIKSQFNIPHEEIAADWDRDIGEILTASPQALKLYTLGKQYYEEGKFRESTEVLMEAVNIDPGFVLAYKRISENYHYLGEIDQAKKYAQMALSLLDQDRVSVRERHLIEGWAFTILEDSPDKAIQSYKKLLQDYPDDEDGNVYLGGIYRQMEEWDLAIEQFEKVQKINPLLACENFVFIFRAKGLYDEARKILLANREIFEESTFRSHLSIIYFCEGKSDLALREAEIAFSLTPEDYNVELIGNIYRVKDNFEKAEENFRQLLEKKNPQSQLSGRFWLAHLYLTQGKYDKCRKEVIQGIEDSRKSNLKSIEARYMLFLAYLDLQKDHYPQALNISIKAEETASKVNLTLVKILSLHFRGLAYLKMNDLIEAKNTTEQLKLFIEKTGIRNNMRYYYHLMGKISQEEDALSDSINNFEQALSSFPHQQDIYDEQAFYLNSLASAYYQAGDLEKASEQYEKIVSLTTGRLRWGDIYARSFYWLGKICQQKGWEGKAIDHYQKFLQLWEEADPGLAETADAKKQLDMLRKTSQS